MPEQLTKKRRIQSDVKEERETREWLKDALEMRK